MRTRKPFDKERFKIALLAYCQACGLAERLSEEQIDFRVKKIAEMPVKEQRNRIARYMRDPDFKAVWRPAVPIPPVSSLPEYDQLLITKFEQLDEALLRKEDERNREWDVYQEKIKPFGDVWYKRRCAIVEEMKKLKLQMKELQSKRSLRPYMTPSLPLDVDNNSEQTISAVNTELLDKALAKRRNK
jgi:hypothetical protein